MSNLPTLQTLSCDEGAPAEGISLPHHPAPFDAKATADALLADDEQEFSLFWARPRAAEQSKANTRARDGEGLIEATPVGLPAPYSFAWLLECWRLEVSNKKKTGSRIGLVTNILRRARRHNTRRYLMMFRLAQYLHAKGGLPGAWGERMNRKLNLKYSVDIGIKAQIAPGMTIAHLPGIVISGYARIGRNFTVRQNTTIGIKTLGRREYRLVLGDDVSIGANSCIIADELVIGSGVTVGAMSFVNRDIPAGTTFYNKRQA